MVLMWYNAKVKLSGIVIKLKQERKINVKKLLTLALAASLLLSACATAETEPSSQGGGTTSTAGTTSTGGDAEDDEPEMRTITILNGMMEDHPPDVLPNESFYAVDLNKALEEINVEIDWILINRFTLTEQKNILINTGDFPDVVPVTQAEMINWADDGILVPLTQYWDEHYPEIDKYLDEKSLLKGQYNGEQYGILWPSNNLGSPNQMYIRTDWIENLDMEMPTNPEELYDVLYAFTFGDPDGNGVDDTFGISDHESFRGTSTIQSYWDVYWDYWSEVDGEIIPDFIRPEMKEVLTYLNKLYADGIFDKDTLVQDMTMLEQKFESGVVGMMGSASWTQNSRTIPNLQKVVEGSTVDTWFAFNDGEQTDTIINTPGGGTRAVTVECEHPEAVLDFFNFMISENDSMAPVQAFNYDIVGRESIFEENYTVLGDKFVTDLSPTVLSGEAAVNRSIMISYNTVGGFTGSLDADGAVEYAELRVENGTVPSDLFIKDLEAVLEHYEYNDLQISGPVYAEYWTDIKTFWDETKVGIISGTMDISAFDDFVNYFYDSNGQAIIDEITAMNAVS